MKAIILAAGIGSRLRPITNNKPKTLVEVNGKPMLGTILDALSQNNIDDVVVCVGFKSELVINYCETNYPTIHFSFIFNEDYETTNNMYSLYLAKDFLNDDMLLMNADLVFDPSVITGLMQQKTTAIAVDKDRYLEESMKVVVAKKRINHISKKIIQADSFGCSIDVYMIKKSDVFLLKKEMKQIIEDNKELNQWTEVMLDNLLHTGKLLAKPYAIGNARWFEIDNFEDLAFAEKLFNKDINLLKNKKIFFIDRDGTLILGKKKLEGSAKFLQKLKKQKKKFFIATNNSSKTPEEHTKAVNDANLLITQENILLSTDAAIDFLLRNKYRRIFWIANKSVDRYLKKRGFIFTVENPQALLLTYDTEMTYDKLTQFCQYVRRGIPYFATHTDMVCPTDNGNVPDIGVFIEAIRLTTGISPNKTFGKPSLGFIDEVLKKYGATYKDAVVIGDRLYTDIALGKDNEVTSILVLTGETKRESYEESNIKADIVVKGIEELLSYI